MRKPYVRKSSEPEIKDHALYIKTLYFLSKAKQGLSLENFSDIPKKDLLGILTSSEDVRGLLDVLVQKGLVEKQGETPGRYVLTKNGAFVYERECSNLENLKILAPLDANMGVRRATIRLRHVQEDLDQARLDVLIYARNDLDDIGQQYVQFAKSYVDSIIEDTQRASQLLQNILKKQVQQPAVVPTEK